MPRYFVKIPYIAWHIKIVEADDAEKALADAVDRFRKYNPSMDVLDGSSDVVNPTVEEL